MEERREKMRQVVRVHREWVQNEWQKKEENPRVAFSNP